jgi:phasin
MSKSPLGSFEIPSEMRNMAEQSVVQARQAFDGFMSAAQKAVATAEQRAAAAQVNVKGAGEKMMGFAEQNVATSFEFAQKLVRAKDVDEMMRLQRDFLNSQMQTLSEQAKELGQSAGAAAQAATDPKR